MIIRNRTPLEYIGYGLYLYFLGLSTRKVTKALSFLYIIKRSNHVSIWKWMDSKVQTSRNVIHKEKKDFRIYNRWNHDKDWIRVHLVMMGCNWIKKQVDFSTKSIWRKEYVCCWAFSIWYCKKEWKMPCFYWWWRNMVSSSL